MLGIIAVLLVIIVIGVLFVTVMLASDALENVPAYKMKPHNVGIVGTGLILIVFGCALAIFIMAVNQKDLTCPAAPVADHNTAENPK